MPDADAYSIDGRTFSFNAAIGDAIPIGAYVRISSGTGRAFLGQVLDWTIAHPSAPGSSTGEPSDRISGRGSLLAELDDGGQSGRLDGSAVFGRGSLEPADAALVSAHLSETMGSSSAIELGELQQLPGVRAELQAKGFGRHTFMCGQ